MLIIAVNWLSLPLIMDQKRKYSTLVLITDSFPFGGVTEPSFVLPEIDCLSSLFERVIIVPTTTYDSEDHYDLPENVEIDPIWIEHPDWRIKMRRGRFLLNPSFWHNIGGKPRRTDLTFAASAYAFAGVMGKWIKARSIDVGETLFYTFWFDFPTVGLALLSGKNGLHYISRAHWHDIYADRAPGLRLKAVEQSCGIFSAGEAGARYLRDEMPSLAGKIAVEHLGCTKAFPEVVTECHLSEEKSITFLSVARVVAQKRVDLNYKFLKALAIARPSTQIRWIHVGDGELMTQLRELVALDCPGNLTVDLRGRQDNQSVHRIYRDEKIDWSMLLSEGEGLPIMVCESLSYGVPVVATMVDGTDEIVDDDCGLLLPADPEPEEFVRGILPYIESDFRMKSLRDEALRKWGESFDARVLRPLFAEKIMQL